jgi:serine/threonine protein kinase
MEWIEGFTLYDWFRASSRDNRAVLQVLAQVMRGLEAVHGTGAIHRDVKGDNIRVTPAGRAVLLDFGSGWYPGARPLTDTCAPPGTAPYRPPELLRFIWRNRKDYDARWRARPSDDLYSLGVTAYRLVTGTYLPPITETGDDKPRKVRRPSEVATVAPELENIILRLISEDREKRGTARKVAAALERRAQQDSRELNQPIRPLLPAVPPDKTPPSRDALSSSPGSTSSRPRIQPKVPARTAFASWLSWVGAATIGAALALGIAELRPDRTERTDPIPTPAEESRVPPIDAPDAGVGDTALASAHALPRNPDPILALGLPMPKQPFPGQRKPPCDPIAERDINGGCWLGPIGTRKPPCGNVAYDYDGGCYAPNFNAPRQPTSNPP